jgi:hypothetical protein
MARRLGIPVRTWYNYEGGVTVPAEVVLRIIELTSVEPTWLLHGTGPKFRQESRGDRGDAAPQPGMTVGGLLRTALRLLESDGSETSVDQNMPLSARAEGYEIPADTPIRQEWLEAQQENRCILVKGQSMAPIVVDGARVAYSKHDDDPRQLDGKMVVVWLEGQPTVRWFRHCGRYALLRAENPEAVPQQQLIDLEQAAQKHRMRRVLWIDTPH